MMVKLFIFGFFCLFMMPFSQTTAAELILYGEPGCIYCAKWRQTIGPIYAKTAEGKKAPVRELLVAEGKGGGNGLASAIVFSPTFVLMNDGKEVGRFLGYQNDEFFWFTLDRLLKQLPAEN